MCGIAGFTRLHGAGAGADELIRRMTAPLAPRGPDGEGFVVESGIALGHRRLKIIDTAGGAQPMAVNGGRYQIVYNGEVYNYLELRRELERRGCVFQTRSDTEVLLHQYILDGAAALEKFNGMFAFGVWDRKEEQLFLARDRIGIKPLYYCVRAGELIFASELKSLVMHPLVERRLNRLSVSKYFTYGYIPAPHTIFEGIHKLEPGCHLLFNRSGLRLHTYWDIPLEDHPPSERTVDEWAVDLLAMLRDAVTRQLRGDTPAGVLLSGGIDSSAVAALAAQASGKRLQTFSIGFDQSSYNESAYARRVAAIFGTEHHEEVLTLPRAAEIFPQVMRSFDEPFADASAIPTWQLSRLAARQVKVVLGGDGGDELFAGYPSFQAHKIVQRLSFLPVGCRDWLGRLARRLPVSHRYTSLEFLTRQFLKGLGLSPEIRFFLWMGFFGNAEKKQLFSADLQQNLLRADPFEDVARHIKQSGLIGDFQRLQYLCLKLYFQDDILLKVDRASMANSLEARVPFMDCDLVEYACRIQPFYKLRGLTTKFVLKRALRGLLPKEIIHRRKAGFMMPVAAWLTNNMRDAIEDLCSPAAIAGTGLFNGAFVRQMLDEHFHQRCDHRKHIYPLLCFMAWLRNHGT